MSAKIVLPIKRTACLLACLTSSLIFAVSPEIITQQQIQKQLRSDLYQGSLNKINEFALNDDSLSLILFTQTLKNRPELPIYSKESLIEESLHALSKMPKTAEAVTFLKELSNYQTQSKIELYDGPHSMHVNATSIPSLTKMVLEQWEVIELSKLFKESIEAGQYDQLLAQQSSDQIWLNATKDAIESADPASLRRLMSTLKQDTFDSNTPRLNFLLAKKLSDHSVLQSSLLQLSNDKSNQGFALKELRQLDLKEYFETYIHVLDSEYLSSFALAQIGSSEHPEASAIIVARLTDPRLGGQAAFALKSMNINDLAELVTGQLKDAQSELHQKRLLLALKLHPDGAVSLQQAMNSTWLSTSVKEDVSAWLN